MQSAKFISRKKLFVFFILLLAAYCSPLTASAQKLDNMTDGEDALIRDAEAMDGRMDIYVHIVDRRLLALSDPNAEQSKQAQKDLENYGKLRTSSRFKLLSDIEKTIAEAIGKIDDVAERDQKNPLFPKSVRILSKACERWLPQLKSLQEQATDDAESAAIVNSIEECREVIEASAKVPKENPKEDKKKKKNE
ncbi:MAG: hypothetical protein ACR2LT_02375 [Pyrinomonadaceae bacterium]